MGIFISVVFVTHGDRIEIVKKLMESINEYRNEDWVEFICVDNGSSPSAYALIRKAYRYIRVIKNLENTGTSRAYNAGIGLANGKYVMILNDDSAIPHGMLKKIKCFLEVHHEIQGIALGLKKDHNTNQALRLKILNLKKIHPTKCRRATFIGTGNLVIKKEIIERVGLYDENYFAGNEDMDLSIRLKKFGVKIYYFPDFYIYHYHVYREKKSSWPSFILARRLSDVYFAQKFFPFFTPFVRLYAIRDFQKRMAKNIDKVMYDKASEIVCLRRKSYYEVQKSLITYGIEETHRMFCRGN
ncbi:MAG: glycosyltransferase family 2 protein [Spirochaetota bacterium]